MKSIGFRMLHFLIFCPLLSQLALWIERLATKSEMVGSNLTACRFISLKISLAVFLTIYLSIFLINYRDLVCK